MKDIYDFLKNFDLHTIIIVGIAFYFLNGNINSLTKEFNTKINSIEKDLSVIEKDLAVIKTVLCVNKIMPSELASNDDQKYQSSVSN